MAQTWMRPAWTRAAAEFVYTTAGLLLGGAWVLVLVVALSVGVATVIVIVGVPIIAVTLVLAHWAADVERERAALVLGHPIARPPRPARAVAAPLARFVGLLRDRRAWRDLGSVLLLGCVQMLAGVVAGAAWSAVLAALAAPAVAPAAPDGSLLGGLSASALVGVAAVGLALVPVAVVVTRLAAYGTAALARTLLAPGDRELLAARVAALETTRSAAVESSDARLQRIERDLHDGAQHRLAFIAMELDRARAKLAQDPASADALLAGAHEESKRALGELRDLVRGIHPSVLTDRGLDAAISGVAERCPVPVDVQVALTERPPRAVETAAYYVVAEALTNVGKHADASRATVHIVHEDGALVVEVGDDGRGGAHSAPGSGLYGLAQRVEALDGHLELHSPQGGPTTLRAQLPCAS